MAREYEEIFGQGNFFLEIQQHGIEEQTRVNHLLVAMSRELSIPLVATNDIHYVTKAEAPAQDVLLCIQTGKVQSEENRMRFPSEEFYLKSEAEMHLLFGEYPEALANTVAIAQRCQVDFQFGKLFLPDYQVPDGYNLKSYLRELCLVGLSRRYPQLTPEISSRLDFELGVINLDPENVAMVEELVRKIHQTYQTTVVLVTHNLFQAKRVAQEGIFLCGGQAVEHQSMALLFNAPRSELTRQFLSGTMIY